MRSPARPPTPLRPGPRARLRGARARSGPRRPRRSRPSAAAASPARAKISSAFSSLPESRTAMPCIRIETGRHGLAARSCATREGRVLLHLLDAASTQERAHRRRPGGQRASVRHRSVGVGGLDRQSPTLGQVGAAAQCVQPDAEHGNGGVPLKQLHVVEQVEPALDGRYPARAVERKCQRGHEPRELVDVAGGAPVVDRGFRLVVLLAPRMPRGGSGRPRARAPAARAPPPASP